MLKQNGFNMSALFSAFNYGRAWARKSGLTDEGRVNRSLSYLMSGDAQEAWKKYSTTLKNCKCPDHTGYVIDEESGEVKASWTPKYPICKHIFALMIATKHNVILEQEGIAGQVEVAIAA